jgi:hypothetical protein
VPGATSARAGAKVRVECGDLDDEELDAAIDAMVEACASGWRGVYR